MGYRFSIETANTIANLTFGKVISCYRDIYSSQESYDGFMYFLDQFHENMRSNETERYIKHIRQVRETLNRLGIRERPRSPEKIEYDDTFLHFHRDALNALRELSDIFDRCAVKSLLLPRMGGRDENFDDRFMMSHETLQHLVKLHPGDSCLILQPQERPRTAAIFDAFPNFEVALRQADLWPAVLFWEGDEDFAFVPIKHEHELNYMYEIVRYERHPIGELKRIAEKKHKSNHYIFQLSDLHFGARNIHVTECRLKSLIKSQLASIGPEDSVGFVVTGDAVDSPNQATENDYRTFSEFIEEHCGQRPLRVLGNHDINNHGLAFFRGRQTIANLVGEYPKIEMLEESKVILLLFNSNTNGKLAEGEIGTSQMSEMGNLLDRIESIKDYLLIAVLHHHLLPIPQPDYYDEKWYKKIMPNGFLDESLKLIDADLFMEWLQQRNIRLAIHGHKHIPFIAERNGVNVVSCGSSTGQITHKERGKTYISYNIFKIADDAVTCTQFAEELLGAGEKNIRTEVIALV